ncbi:RHS repeat-associated core domain-containing protein, partial [Cellulophaga lytica]|uniref:RHS repeat-associated core domain-containing protein n=1 Tax=Cellulophaga lytica TaxID=979 RepID=UPI0026E2647B
DDLELCYNRFRYYSPDSGTYISQDPIGLHSGEPNFYAYVTDSNTWVDVFGLAGAGTGGAYMFGFESGDMYIGKGESGRMTESIGIRQKQVGNSSLKGSAHVSTGGNNELGKMVEYKTMKNEGFEKGAGGVPDGFLNSYLRGETAWNDPKNKHLQADAIKLSDKLKADYDADVKRKAKISCIG